MSENKSGRDYLFNKFRTEVLKESNDNKVLPIFHNKLIVFIYCIIIVLLNTGLLIYNNYSPIFYPNKILSIIGLTIINISSVLMIIILSFSRKLSDNTIDNVSIVFNLITDVSVLLLIIERNKNLSFAGNESMAFSYSIVYLVIISIAPSKRLIDAVLLSIGAIASIITPLFFEGSDYYFIVGYIIYFIILIVIYIYFYFNNKKQSAIKNKLIEINYSLINASYLDAMTNCFNRRAYYEYVRNISNDENINQVGIIIFDIDDFKAYNDLYSHSKGDNCLQLVSKTVMDILDENDRYLFRYGGEEFVCFVINPEKEELLELAKRMVQKTYEANIQRYDSPFKRVTITCGAAILKVMHGVNADYIIKADEQLYIGKDSGKNCTVFENNVYKNY